MLQRLGLDRTGKRHSRVYIADATTMVVASPGTTSASANAAAVAVLAASVVFTPFVMTRVLRCDCLLEGCCNPRRSGAMVALHDRPEVQAGCVLSSANKERPVKGHRREAVNRLGWTKPEHWQVACILESYESRVVTQCTGRVQGLLL